jgi:hypothetical protein
MPQLQLPFFPAGVTEINNHIAVEKREGTVYYVHGHLPVSGWRKCQRWLRER